jgi:hypothetical protein
MRPSLAKGLFQRAYVTTDLDHAMAAVGETYGVRDYLRMRDVPFDGGGTVQIALAWVSNDMIELIEPSGGIPLYDCLLPASGYAMCFHHYGHLLDSEQEWDAMSTEVARQKLTVALQGDTGMFRYLYADSRPTFGHFLEFIHCSQEGARFFEQVPRTLAAPSRMTNK